MATLTSIAPPPVVAATPAASAAPSSDARTAAVHAEGPHRGSFASAMSRADGRHAAARAPASAATREDPAAATPPVAGPGATGGKGGKKAANAGGDDSPPDGSALPLVDAQLAAAANLSLPVTPDLAPAPTGTAAAASVAGTLAAAASAPPAGSDAPTDAPAAPAASPPATDVNSARSPPPPASGLVRPMHAVPTGGEFRAVTERPGPAVAPLLPAPGTAPAVAPAQPAPVVAAVAPPPPKPVSVTDEFSLKTTPWTPTPAVTDGPVVAPETARALAPVLAADAGNATHIQGGTTAGDGKPDANAVLPAALAPPMPPSLPASPVAAQVATPVGSPDWPQQLGDRVAVLVNQNLTNAQIKISPAHLGPLEIRIAVSDGQANIAFTSHSQVTREALEAAAPKLREMLGGQGFAHVNVDVSPQQFRDRAPKSTRYEPEFSFAAGASAATPVAAAPSVARDVASRLDTYA